MVPETLRCALWGKDKCCAASECLPAFGHSRWASECKGFVATALSVFGCFSGYARCASGIPSEGQQRPKAVSKWSRRGQLFLAFRENTFTTTWRGHRIAKRLNKVPNHA